MTTTQQIWGGALNYKSKIQIWIKETGEIEGVPVNWKVVLKKLFRMWPIEEKGEGRKNGSDEDEIGTTEHDQMRC